MRKQLIAAVAACIAVLAPATIASAQQTLNFSVGWFTPRGEDARVNGDVLIANRDFLTFDIKDFNSATVGGEWLVPLGRYFEGGAGVAFSRSTVPSVYTSFVDSDGSEIEQNLRLRLIPVSFTIRVLPLGQTNPVQPYFGAGLGIFNWRYSETGEFVDFAQAGRPIFRDEFVASGSETGPIAVAGLRFAGSAISAGGEIRYQKAEADLNSDFAGNKLDLGGWTYQFTFGFRFK